MHSSTTNKNTICLINIFCFNEIISKFFKTNLCDWI